MSPGHCLDTPPGRRDGYHLDTELDAEMDTDLDTTLDADLDTTLDIALR